jgi:hypothetical protein
MYIPQVDEIVKVKTDMYEGLGRVVYIDHASLYVNHYNSIQVEMDESYDGSGHKLLRVNLKEIKPTFKIIIAGGRDFSDYKLLKAKADALLKNKNTDDVEIVIVSGTAKGADKLGEKYQKLKKYTLKQFPANWNRQPDGSYDKSAGFLRNIDMAEYSDACLLFWNGESTGTKSMKELAEKHGLQLRVVSY